ncbi:MAG TPA: molybdate ABC transporter substrate-binding protein [Pyrinomonadaceae bacterium]|nr:molybdate ABC transporter substrate-binding protein [Pyrinomonadaceae bacterium]
MRFILGTTAKSVLMLSLLLLSWAGCGRPADVAEGSGEIVVAAASNLTDAFEELGRRFEERAGVGVTFSFGSSADLARQIENGAPFDVFASADTEHAEALARKGLLSEESLVVYARGRLVVWLPPGGRARVERLEDLAGPGVSRVAVARPEAAPYGRAAVEALKSLGIWEQVEPKLIYGQNVAQARQFAATGNVDAAFLPRALARRGGGTIVEIDARLHQPIRQAAGVVRASRKQDAARKFLEFVLSAEGQALLREYGYESPAGN